MKIQQTKTIKSSSDQCCNYPTIKNSVSACMVQKQCNATFVLETSGSHDWSMTNTLSASMSGCSEISPDDVDITVEFYQNYGAHDVILQELYLIPGDMTDEPQFNCYRKMIVRYGGKIICSDMKQNCAPEAVTRSCSGIIKYSE